MQGVTNPAQCCCDDLLSGSACNCRIWFSNSGCTMFWTCDGAPFRLPHRVIVAEIDPATEEIIEVISDTVLGPGEDHSGSYNPPADGLPHTYQLYVCCTLTEPETFEECTYEYDGEGWVFVGAPEGCVCNSVPLVPTPEPDVGERITVPCFVEPP